MIGLPRSPYYRRPRESDEHDVEADADLRAAISRVQQEFPEYGDRRVTRELRAGRHRANHKRVQRVMQAMLRPPSARRRPWVVAAPDSVSGSWYPNLRAEIIPTGANQLWVSDITYVRLERAFVFLAVVLDVFARKVIGYAIGPTLDARLPRAALDAAIERRQPPPGCVHHHEEIYPRGNRTMADVIAHLPHFLEQIYNNKRQHSALNYRSPNAFEADHALTLPSSQISTT